jgi:phospholipid/cholesterol/gamma-HCH transport system substrate-binding protein
VEQVQLTLSITNGTPIKEDTVAILQTQGLTGIAYVELSDGHKDSPVLKAQPGEDYPVIRSGPSLLNRLDAAVTALLANLTRATDNFNAVLNEDNRRAIGKTLADLEVLSRTLARRSPAIDSSLADTARTMRNAAQFTAELPGVLARIERTADRFDRMADSIARAGESGTQTFESTRADLEAFTSEGLPEVRQLVSELRELTSTLGRASGAIERNPSTLVWGRPPAKRGPGE